MVGDERPRIGATRLRLQHGRLNLEELSLVEPATNATHQQGPTTEGFTRLRRDNQIEIALAIALLHISKSMPFVGQGLKRLAQHAPITHFHRQLTAVSATQRAAHTQPVPSIHKGGDLFEPSLLLGLQARFF